MYGIPGRWAGNLDYAVFISFGTSQRSSLRGSRRRQIYSTRFPGLFSPSAIMYTRRGRWPNLMIAMRRTGDGIKTAPSLFRGIMTIILPRQVAISIISVQQRATDPRATILMTWVPGILLPSTVRSTRRLARHRNNGCGLIWRLTRMSVLWPTGTRRVSVPGSMATTLTLKRSGRRSTSTARTSSSTVMTIPMSVLRHKTRTDRPTSTGSVSLWRAPGGSAYIR